MEFRSLKPGVRHICGHDIHTTVGVAIAEGVPPVALINGKTLTEGDLTGDDGTVAVPRVAGLETLGVGEPLERVGRIIWESG